MADQAQDAGRSGSGARVDLRDWGSWVGLGGLALVALGAFLPWSEADVLLLHVTTKGTDGDGVITLAAVGVAAVLFAVVKAPAARGWLLLMAALTSGTVAVYDASNLAHTARRLAGSPLPVDTRAGIGLWLTGLGAALALVGGLQLLIEARRGLKA